MKSYKIVAWAFQADLWCLDHKPPVGCIDQGCQDSNCCPQPVFASEEGLEWDEHGDPIITCPVCLWERRQDQKPR